MKFQALTSSMRKRLKLQTPNFREMSNCKLQTGARTCPARILGFGAWSFSEVWSLKFGVFLSLLSQAAPMSAQTLLLTGATVHTVSGETLSPGPVLIRDGKIAAVGRTVPASGATSVALKGQHLYPGMIALNSMLGLVEIEAVRATRDS